MKQFFLFVFILITSQVYCQYTGTHNYDVLEVGKTTYYIKDGNLVIGGNLVDGGDILNSRYCQVKELNNVLRYSPDEVSEYGFSDGRIYYSKTIELNGTVKKVFLYKMKSGKTSLYFCKLEEGNLFFLSGKDSVLRRVPNKNMNDSISYHDFLVNYMQDCPSAKAGAMRVSYSSLGLKRLLKNYDACKPKYTPFVKYGIVTSLEFKKLIISEKLYHDGINWGFDFRSKLTFLPGIFIDVPLFASDISLHSELTVFKNRYSSTLTDGIKKSYFFGNATGVNIPVLFRYTLPLMKSRPFINVGGTYAYQWKVNSDMYTSTSNGGTTVNIYLERYTPKISKQVAGWLVGAGMEILVTNKNSLFFEFRYNNNSGLNNQENFNESAFNLMLSYNL